MLGEHAAGIALVDDLLFRDEVRRLGTDPLVGRASPRTVAVASLTAIALLTASRRAPRARAWTQLGSAVVLRVGSHAGLYSLAFSFSVFVLLTLVAFDVIAFRAAGVVARIEEERVERDVPSAARAQVTAELDRARTLAEALRQNQAQLQAIVDHAPAAIYVKDAQGRLLLVNRHAEAAYGKPREALIGIPEVELLPRETIDVIHAHDAIVRERGVPLEAEEDIIMPDGCHTYLSVKFTLPGPDGSPLLAGISTDTSTRSRASSAWPGGSSSA